VTGRVWGRGLLALAGVAALWLAPAAARGQGVTVRHSTGRLADGGSWIADVPSRWNGTLLLYSHGYGITTPADAPLGSTGKDLLGEGYALTGSSYDPTGSLWQMGSAVRDQFQTLSAVERNVLRGRPRDVIAFGTSMGGLISALEDQRSYGRIDGALTTCGIVAGGELLGNYRLDGEYTIDRLLAGGSIQLVGYRGNKAARVAAASRLAVAAARAQTTAAGRARLNLAMSLNNTAPLPPGDTTAAATDYPAGHVSTSIPTARRPPVSPFIQTGPEQIELAAGGNPNWTAGVDFSALVDQSPYKPQIEALYRAARLSLGADLSTLTRNATIRANPRALRWIEETSAPNGRLQVPELDLHTISDQLVPVQEERFYANQVRARGSASLLRQAFVQHPGHCDFTPADLVAGVQAIQHRVDTGRWDQVTTPSALNARANGLGYGAPAPAFTPFDPPPLSGDNGPFNPR
jgi:hypothetical protein